MSAGAIISTLLQIAGSLCFLLFGMKMMSDGIQKSAGQKMQSALGFMTGNRFKGLLTGCILTMLIQSSGATTAMVVSFVNAELISLTQAIAVIFGANIGTTVTAWIVALFGFNFKISAFAIPIFGAGYILTLIHKWHKEGIGNALMGFGMLFVALGWLSDTISMNATSMAFLPVIQSFGIWSIPLGALIGIAITALIHSSSAMTAIVITMAFSGMLNWEFSASIIIGSNIGSTIDSIMAAFGASTSAKRTSLVHVLFNFITAILALIFIKPLCHLVDIIVPGPAYENMTYHIAMLHTLFNVMGTTLFIPFIKQIALLTEKIIPASASDSEQTYTFKFSEHLAHESPTIPVVAAQKEVSRMADLSVKMFDHLQYGFADRSGHFVAEHYEPLVKEEAYLNQMEEQITEYLAHCQEMNIDISMRENIKVMMNITSELKSMSDDCMSVGNCIRKISEKQYFYQTEDFDRLLPYLELSRQLLQFIYKNINKKLNKDQLDFAREIEQQIEGERRSLKKIARNRLEHGANVKAELLYIDLIRKIEKIGDRCYAIAEQLSLTK